MATKCRVAVFSRHKNDHFEEWAFEWGCEPAIILDYEYDGDLVDGGVLGGLSDFNESFTEWLKSNKSSILRSLDEVVDFDVPRLYVKDDRVVGLCMCTPDNVYVELDVTWVK